MRAPKFPSIRRPSMFSLMVSLPPASRHAKCRARVSAVGAGASQPTGIREDPTLNIAAGDDLEARFPGVELILFESGGDNLASTFSLDLVDWWMFVIDVAGGDDIPR